MTKVTWNSQRDTNPPEKRRMLVEAIGWQVRTQSHIWSPPTDVYELETAYMVRVEVGGMRPQNFSVQIDNNYLIISGSRVDKPERRAYFQMEVRSGEFSTVVAIPGPVNQEEANAEYDDGFLVVTLPKAPDNNR
jgi:HSP20 family protein